MTYDILFIGHCTRDDITISGKTEYHPGGGSYFGASSAGWCNKRFGNDNVNLAVLTIGRPEDYKTVEDEIGKAGVKLDLIKDDHTTVFLHSFLLNFQTNI